MSSNQTGVLTDHPLLKKLHADHISEIMECASEASFVVGTYLCRVGEDADRFYLIKEGKIALELNIPGRITLNIQTIGAGGIVGCSWLFPPYEWHFDARVLEPTSALSLNAKALRSVCEKNHELGYALLKEFSRILFDRLMSTRFQLINVYDL